MTLCRLTEAFGSVGHLVAPHDFTRVGPTKIIAHEHALLAFDTHAERVEAEGEVVVPVLADRGVGRDGQSPRRPVLHGKCVDERHVTHSGVGADTEVPWDPSASDRCRGRGP
jgi:hypothetical protein